MIIASFAPIIGAIKALASELTTLEQTVSGFAQSFTSDSITANKVLCVADSTGAKTCVTKAQLDAVLSSQGAASQVGQGRAPAAPTITASAAPPADTATTTPDTASATPDPSAPDASTTPASPVPSAPAPEPADSSADTAAPGTTPAP